MMLVINNIITLYDWMKPVYCAGQGRQTNISSCTLIKKKSNLFG